MSAKCVISVLVLAVAASAETAAAQPLASFDSAGVHFEVPVPSGFCPPQGELAEFAQRAATADVQNVSHLTFYDCDQQGSERIVDYILIKTPRPALGARVTREQLMADLGAEFAAAPSGGSMLSDESLEAIEGRIASAMGTRLNLAGAVRPLGRDSECAYLGGTFTVTGPTGTFTVAAAACITTVADRVITINWYGADRGSEGMVEMLARARHLASRIRGTPTQ